jgi:hypothetical protein
MTIFLKQQSREERKKICDSCENKKQHTCGVCGCFLIALHKIAAAGCPLNKF